jgi:glycosyltransferase involved in cell wall biosynthesis
MSNRSCSIKLQSPSSSGSPAADYSAVPVPLPTAAVPSGITTVIINYRTPDLLDRASRSFRSFYPAAHLVIIDNGSADGSLDVARSRADADRGNTHLILNSTNLHHGPAMDQALRAVQAGNVLFLDSDCEVIAGGWIERMRDLLAGENAYAAGKLIRMNDRGFDVPEGEAGHPYIRPICMMLKRRIYLSLPPFHKHGAPCLANMVGAEAKGFGLIDTPVEEFVVHHGRGTASRHGYQLGMRGIINHLLNKAGL